MVKFMVNGKKKSFAGSPFKRLIDVLREDLRLTGTKEGCGEGECGACTVLVEGEPVNSCLIPVCQMEGRKIETIESLGNSQKLHPLQEAFIAEENLPNREPSLSRRGLVFAVAGIDGGIDLRVLPPSGDGGPRAGLALGNSVGKPRCASNLVSSRSSVIIEIGTNSAAQEGQSKGSISKTRRKHTAHDLAAALTALEIALSPEATVSISIGWTDDAGCFG